MSSSRPGALRDRLLEVEVEVAQRAGRDDAVGLGVLRVPEVAFRLLQRGFLAHRDDREAAALVDARVLDDRAAERFDDLREVRVAWLVGVDAQPVWGARCNSRRRADLQVRERALDPARSSSRPMSSTSSHRKFLFVRPFS